MCVCVSCIYTKSVCACTYVYMYRSTNERMCKHVQSLVSACIRSSSPSWIALSSPRGPPETNPRRRGCLPLGSPGLSTSFGPRGRKGRGITQCYKVLQRVCFCVGVYVYAYVCVCTRLYVLMYIYIHTESERERERESWGYSF